MHLNGVRRMLLAMLVMFGLLVAPGVGQAAVEPSDFPVTGFTISYGQSVLTGTLTWTNRSVGITGSVKARSTAKQGWFWGYGNYQQTWCNPVPQTRTTAAGTTRGFSFSMSCDIVGGFDFFYVELRDSYSVLGGMTCTRSGCVRY